MTSLPGIVLILGALLLPVLKGNLRKVALVALPILSFVHLMGLPDDYTLNVALFGLNLELVRVDKLSMVWGIVFHIAALLSAIYALHEEDIVQLVAGLMYAGAAIGAAFAGDLVTLFVYWELTAITSVFLIWANRTEAAYRTGMRYLVIQVGSGVLLLAGLVLHYADTGSIAFGHLGLVSTGTTLIFIAFGIKAAFPLLHNWLQDAYPNGTVVGTVFLSAFTTKLAIYALARGFAGESILIPIGATMTLFPIFFAVIENDLRRVLAYSLNNQLGFMVVGIGIGTELALNGTAAHAFAHIIYKGLLFMSMGAVLHRTGTIKASELGGLYKSMPLTAVFCIVGSLSISGFPLFSGFVSKSMVLTAAADGHMMWLSLALLVASAGVVDHSGIKIPFFAFFAHDSGRRVKEAPLNMLIAMGAAALICIGIGVRPDLLYAILPYAVDYEPYTASHVMFSLQLLLFAALAFALMMRHGIYPPEIRSVNLDFDWTYRKALPALVRGVERVGGGAWSGMLGLGRRAVDGTIVVVSRAHQPGSGVFGEPWPASQAAKWVAIVLGVTLILWYL
jgi:multicomponent Na+:H+ antiporter subunit D